jgi:hypothetical protein
MTKRLAFPYAKTSKPEEVWFREVELRREVLAQKQRAIDAMRAAGQPKPREAA